MPDEKRNENCHGFTVVHYPLHHPASTYTAAEVNNMRPGFELKLADGSSVILLGTCKVIEIPCQRELDRGRQNTRKRWHVLFFTPTGVEEFAATMVRFVQGAAMLVTVDGAVVTLHGDVKAENLAD